MSDLISTPSIGSKSNPLLPLSIEDIKNIPVTRNRIFYKYTCECGTDFIKSKRSGMSDYVLTHCRNCSSRYTNTLIYGENYYNQRASKTKETLIKEFGSLDAAYKSQQDTREQSNLALIGFKNYFQSDETKKKIKETCMKKYNVSYALQSRVVSEKIAEANIQKYGSPSPFGNKDVQDKSKKTKLKKYGEEYYNNRPKAEQTCLAKYGVTNPNQSEEYRHNLKTRYFYDNIYFDSSWEVAYYIYLRDNNISFTYHPSGLKYYIQGKVHMYFPDFEVEGALIEIKGDHMIKNGHLVNPISNEALSEKEECIKLHNVSILTYKDLKDILKWCKTKYGKSFFRSIKLE